MGNFTSHCEGEGLATYLYKYILMPLRIGLLTLEFFDTYIVVSTFSLVDFAQSCGEDRDLFYR